MKTYAYDADNRLSEAVITKEGTQTLSQKNTYNGDGQRISKTDNNVTTKYSYQEGSVVYTDGSNENKSLNIMGEVGNIIAAERGTGSYFYNKDMRGSTTTILDGAGNSEVSYEYTDFGATTAKGDFYNEICYTGGIYDNTTGLYYLNARYYDPDDGRFVTQDTYRGDMNDPSSLHLYAYCANNPVNYVDPSGNFWETILDVASIGWSAYDLARKPSWVNAGYLMWDIGATFLPFVPGSYSAKGLKGAKKATKIKKVSLKVPSRVSELRGKKLLTVGKYKALSKVFKGAKNRSKIEIHHVLEKRFFELISIPSDKWPVIALDKDLHRVITNRFRKAKPYLGTARYRSMSKRGLQGIVRSVYYDMPQLQKIALSLIDVHFKPWRGGGSSRR